MPTRSPENHEGRQDDLRFLIPPAGQEQRGVPRLFLGSRAELSPEGSTEAALASATLWARLGMEATPQHGDFADAREAVERACGAIHDVLSLRAILRENQASKSVRTVLDEPTDLLRTVRRGERATEAVQPSLAKVFNGEREFFMAVQSDQFVGPLQELVGDRLERVVLEPRSILTEISQLPSLQRRFDEVTALRRALHSQPQGVGTPGDRSIRQRLVRHIGTRSDLLGIRGLDFASAKVLRDPAVSFNKALDARWKGPRTISEVERSVTAIADRMLTRELLQLSASADKVIHSIGFNEATGPLLFIEDKPRAAYPRRSLIGRWSLLKVLQTGVLSKPGSCEGDVPSTAVVKAWGQAQDAIVDHLVSQGWKSETDMSYNPPRGNPPFTLVDYQTSLRPAGRSGSIEL